MGARVFISLTGPENNFGDFYIRRAALNWTAAAIDRSVFVGRHNDEWLAAAGVEKADTVVRGRERHRLTWLLSAAVSRKRPILVTDPGEVWLVRSRYIHHLVHLIVARVITWRHGTVIIPPHAIAQQRAASIWSPTLRLHRALAKLADVCLWRDKSSLEQVGAGDLVPDIAFSGLPRAGHPDEIRRRCLVSLRGDREFPSDECLKGIAMAAGQAEFEIITFAQVDRDSERAAAVAERLGGRHDARALWKPDAESDLQAMYDEAALVISDRLHVLALAALSGAMPIEIATNPETKVTAHFATIGVRDISLNSAGRSSEDIAAWISTRLTWRPCIRNAVASAHASLAEWSRRVHRLVGD